MEIYYNILDSINNAGLGVVPTRIQQNCNLSYDKFSKYIEELKQKELIDISNMSITEKGKQLLSDYQKIKDFLEKMNLEYVKSERALPHV